MRFMVIERFADGDARPIYRRFARSGRMMPEGIDYVASWISADFSTCYQIMEAPDAAALQRWVAAWSDIVEFEIVPVVTDGEEAARHAAER